MTVEETSVPTSPFVSTSMVSVNPLHTGAPAEPVTPVKAVKSRVTLRGTRQYFAGPWRYTALIVVEIIVGLALWQAIVSALKVDPLIVPGPISVLKTLWALLQSPLLYSAMGVTMEETMLGFVIGAGLGIILAILLSEFALLDRIANPIIVGFQAMPKIAIAPLFIIWFGFGISSKVVLIVVIVFFPVLVNMVAGLNSADREQVELMQVYRASRTQTLRRLRFYASLPFLFASFEVTLVLSLTGAVFAEILGSGSTTGLGTLMQLYTSRIAVSAIFAMIIVLSFIGIVLYAVVKVASRYLLRWQNPARR
jgi:NitT/TauT family transport system permease protein